MNKKMTQQEIDNERFRASVRAAAAVLGENMEQFSKRFGVCRATLDNWCKQPDKMTVHKYNHVLDVCRAVGIQPDNIRI